MSLLTIFSAHVKFTVKEVLCVGSGLLFIRGVFKTQNDEMPTWLPSITLRLAFQSDHYLSLRSSWII